MEAIYLDLHIHTSQDANHPNEDYDVAELVSQIKKLNGDAPFLISLTDHNMINKGAYKKAQSLGINLLLGVELHIKHHDDEKSYHCHIFFKSEINEETIDGINAILDDLYPNKLPDRENPDTPNIQTIVNRFDAYEFMLLPHGSQAHGAFNYSLHDDEKVDNAIYRSIYYNQFDGFTARSNNGLEKTRRYFTKLGIGEFVNLITCSDNYNPKRYPEPHSNPEHPFVPTWMFAEPTFDGVRLSLSESSRLLYQNERPEKSSEYISRVAHLTENIDIKVDLKEGLNVVIGGSSTGKTLLVDSIWRAVNEDFEGSAYMNFGVERMQVTNHSRMHPYYISQNFIAENINNKEERSIDKISILKNIFPGDEQINHQIAEALALLNVDLCDMLQLVKNIEQIQQRLEALAHPGKLIVHGTIKKNLFTSLLPLAVDKSVSDYSTIQYEKHLAALNDIKSVLSQTPYAKNADEHIDYVIEQLRNVNNAARLFDVIEEIVVKQKELADEELLKIQGRNQEIVQSKESLMRLISDYVGATKKFYTLREKISRINYTFNTSTVESMGHKLHIQNKFKFDQQTMLSSLDKYLKFNIRRLADVTPENLFSSNFKERPRVESYEDLAQKIHSDLLSSNTKSYSIISKDGRNFNELSPGWKTAIILDLILGYKKDNAPIIIDQPEDNLAISYINKDLVETIKSVKERKQIILVSHNATIPMMADAQNIILCRNENNKIVIRSAPVESVIDGKPVLEIIAEQTDGGKSSIKKRVKKYNLKKFN